VDLCTEGILVPGHVMHKFLCTSSPSPSASPPSTFNPVVYIVSTVNLHWDCPPSLLQALALSHPNCEVWLLRNYEEMNGIEELGTFKCLTLVNTTLYKRKALQRQPLLCAS
jgi:hypothetical protein